MSCQPKTRIKKTCFELAFNFCFSLINYVMLQHTLSKFHFSLYYVQCFASYLINRFFFLHCYIVTVKSYTTTCTYYKLMIASRVVG